MDLAHCETKFVDQSTEYFVTDRKAVSASDLEFWSTNNKKYINHSTFELIFCHVCDRAGVKPEGIGMTTRLRCSGCLFESMLIEGLLELKERKYQASDKSRNVVGTEQCWKGSILPQFVTLTFEVLD